MFSPNVIRLQGNDEKSTNILNNEWVISVRELVIFCSIGILEHEKQAKQPVRISVKCYATLNQSQNSDFKYICYDDLIHKIEAFMGQGHIDLIEFAAQGICNLCFTFQNVHRVFVSVEKTMIYPNVTSVGIEIERVREIYSF
jgi:dihydroneopterin aldolase